MSSTDTDGKRIASAADTVTRSAFINRFYQRTASLWERCHKSGFVQART